MAIPEPFQDRPVIGKLPPEAAAAKLREMGDPETAEQIDEISRESKRKGRKPGASLRP